MQASNENNTNGFITSHSSEHISKDSNKLNSNILSEKVEIFNELIKWFKEWGHEVVDTTKKNPILDIQLQAKINPLLPYSSGLNTPFFLEFQNDLDDGFIIRTTFELDENIDLFLKKQNNSKEIELIYIQIEQLVLPLGISIIKSHPNIFLYKILFYKELKKQYFLDSINNLVHSMILITGKWDEKYYQSRPITQNKELVSNDFKIKRAKNDLFDALK